MGTDVFGAELPSSLLDSTPIRACLGGETISVMSLDDKVSDCTTVGDDP